jgi:hypothetical protein
MTVPDRRPERKRQIRTLQFSEPLGRVWYALPMNVAYATRDHRFGSLQPEEIRKPAAGRTVPRSMVASSGVSPSFAWRARVACRATGWCPAGVAEVDSMRAPVRARSRLPCPCEGQVMLSQRHRQLRHAHSMRPPRPGSTSRPEDRDSATGRCVRRRRARGRARHTPGGRPPSM